MAPQPIIQAGFCTAAASRLRRLPNRKPTRAPSRCPTGRLFFVCRQQKDDKPRQKEQNRPSYIPQFPREETPQRERPQKAGHQQQRGKPNRGPPAEKPRPKAEQQAHRSSRQAGKGAFRYQQGGKNHQKSHEKIHAQSSSLRPKVFLGRVNSRSCKPLGFTGDKGER